MNFWIIILATEEVEGGSRKGDVKEKKDQIKEQNQKQRNKKRLSQTPLKPME